MTPKEKAKQLVEKFMEYADYYYSYKYDEGFLLKNAKQCALIAVDEICDAINWHEFDKPNKEWDYWEQVKKEIQNL